MNFTSNTQRSACPLLFVILLLAAMLAGCADPSAASQPTSQALPITAPPIAQQPAAAPTALPHPTAAPTALPHPTTAPQPTLSAPATDTGAIQTVLNYYIAIQEHRLDQAYEYWANNGAASHQTLAEFKQGLLDTVQVDLRLGMPAAQGTGVIVPVMLAAVVNDTSSAGGQRVQHFSGTYTMQPDSGSDTGWRIATANIAEGASSLPGPVAADPNGPAQALQEYYDAIGRHEYARAYTIWANFGTASQQSFAQFAQGFATTTHVTIDLGSVTSEGAAGSIYATAPIVIMASTSDKGAQTFCGTYTLRRANIPPFDQLGWHIERATIVPTASVQPGSAEEQQLLNGGCKSG